MLACGVIVGSLANSSKALAHDLLRVDILNFRLAAGLDSVRLFVHVDLGGAVVSEEHLVIEPEVEIWGIIRFLWRLLLDHSNQGSRVYATFWRPLAVASRFRSSRDETL